MQVELNYHRGTLPVTVAPDWRATVVRKPAMPILADPSAAVAQALNQPVGAPPLAELAGTARRALALFAAGAAVVYFAAMTWHTGRAAIAKYQIGEYVIAQSTLTIWPTRFLVPLGCGVLVLALLVTAIRREPPTGGPS